MAKSSWYYERQATTAKAREDYYRNNPPAPPAGAIEQRGETSTLYYRSLLQFNGLDPLIYRVDVRDETLALVPATDLGLLTTLGAGETALRLRGSGVKPTKIHWYQGAATPTRSTTPWGSSVSRYYADNIYSAPFSQAVGVFSAKDLAEAFDGLFGAGGSRLALLGPANGRAWIEFEQAPISYLT